MCEYNYYNEFVPYTLRNVDWNENACRELPTNNGWVKRFLASNTLLFICSCSHTTWDAIMCIYFVNRKENNCLIKNFCYTVSCLIHCWAQTSPFLSLCIEYCNSLLLLYSLREHCAMCILCMSCLLSHIICSCRCWKHVVFVAKPVKGQKILETFRCLNAFPAYPTKKNAIATLR